MFAVLEYLTILNGESVRLRGKKLPSTPLGHFSTRLMTVHACIVHKWVPPSAVEDFKMGFSPLLITPLSFKQHCKKVMWGR